MGAVDARESSEITQRFCTYDLWNQTATNGADKQNPFRELTLLLHWSLRVIQLTLQQQQLHLQWHLARAMWNAVDYQCVVFSDEFHFAMWTDYHRAQVWRVLITPQFQSHFPVAHFTHERHYGLESNSLRLLIHSRRVTWNIYDPAMIASIVSKNNYILPTPLTCPQSSMCGTSENFSFQCSTVAEILNTPSNNYEHIWFRTTSSIYLTPYQAVFQHVAQCEGVRCTIEDDRIAYHRSIHNCPAGMEQHQNERAGETGDPRENPPTNGIVRVTRSGIEPISPWNDEALGVSETVARIAPSLLDLHSPLAPLLLDLHSPLAPSLLDLHSPLKGLGREFRFKSSQSTYNVLDDCRRGVTSLKLSPNLRKEERPSKKAPSAEPRQLEINKLEKLLALVRDPPAVTKPLSDIERVSYVKVALEEEPASLIRSLILTDANYEFVCYHIEATLLAAEMRINSPSTLRGLLTCLSENPQAFKALDLRTKHWEHLLIHIMKRKLDSKVRKLWELIICDTGMHSLDDFVNFSEATTESQSSSEWFDIAKHHYLCLNCLWSDYRAATCSSKSLCRSCDAKHHMLMHFDSERAETLPIQLSDGNHKEDDTLDSNTALDAKLFQWFSENVYTSRLYESHTGFISEHCFQQLGLSRRKALMPIKAYLLLVPSCSKESQHAYCRHFVSLGRYWGSLVLEHIGGSKLWSDASDNTVCSRNNISSSCVIISNKDTCDLLTITIHTIVLLSLRTPQPNFRLYLMVLLRPPRVALNICLPSSELHGLLVRFSISQKLNRVTALSSNSFVIVSYPIVKQTTILQYEELGAGTRRWISIAKQPAFADDISAIGSYQSMLSSLQKLSCYMWRVSAAFSLSHFLFGCESSLMQDDLHAGSYSGTCRFSCRDNMRLKTSNCWTVHGVEFTLLPCPDATKMDILAPKFQEKSHSGAGAESNASQYSKLIGVEVEETSSQIAHDRKGGDIKDEGMKKEREGTQGKAKHPCGVAKAVYLHELEFNGICQYLLLILRVVHNLTSPDRLSGHNMHHHRSRATHSTGESNVRPAAVERPGAEPEQGMPVQYIRWLPWQREMLQKETAKAH
ncbi:hypothetical protein PR048_009702 [Dryococelus australis]|uniref:Uncharacterized protein n=1 Tax=Dryococelus australis TaxID=614101 RepID=A0ABQ9I0L8_9NEOP|nr:hypothetical protein PR048_009702 [Dryococelus australis]